MREPRLEIILAVIGGIDPDDGCAACWRTALEALLVHLRKRYSHTPITVLTPLVHAGERAAADIALQYKMAVCVTPRRSNAVAPPSHMTLLPEHLLDASCSAGANASDLERTAELICRYAHLIVTFDPAHATPHASELSDLVLDKWRRRDFHFGDEGADVEALELLSEPMAGGTLRVSSPGTDNRPRRPGWRTGDAIRKPDTLAMLNRANHDIARANAAAVQRSSESLLNTRDLAAVKADLGVAAVDVSARFESEQERLRQLFARADASAIRMNATLGASNLWFAAAAPLAIAVFEGVKHIDESRLFLAIVLYLVVTVLALALGGLLTFARAQARQNVARVTAELVRVLFFWRLAGVNARLESALGRWSPNRHASVQMIARSLDFMAASMSSAPANLTAHTHRVWIGPPSADPVSETPAGPAGSQVVWYSVNARKIRSQGARLTQYQTGAFLLALFIATTSLAFLALGENLEGNGAFVLPIAISVLPALAGAFSIYRERSALPTLAENYERMARIANTASKRLTKATSQNDAKRSERIVEQFGREVVGESLSWLLAHTHQKIGATMAS